MGTWKICPTVSSSKIPSRFQFVLCIKPHYTISWESGLIVAFTWQNPSEDLRPFQALVPSWSPLSAVTLEDGNRTVHYFSAFCTVVRTAWADCRESQFLGGMSLHVSSFRCLCLPSLCPYKCRLHAAVTLGLWYSLFVSLLQSCLSSFC